MAENVRPKSFREIVVPSDAGTRWKEITVNTGASASTLQDIKVPDSCDGYSYIDSGTHQPSVTNRFIYWRTSNDVLELVEESLDYNLIGSHVRFRFLDTQIIGGVSVHESHGNVIILVVTVASVHRLVFPHPFILERNDIGYTSVEHPIPSIFYDASLAAVTDPKNMHLLNSNSTVTSQLHGAATYLNADGQALFTLCSNTGSILLVKMPPLGIQGIIQQFELSQSSMMQKLWSGLVPSVMMRGGQESPEAVTGMVLHPFHGDTCIFAVCRDHKMRIWSTKTHECVTVYNLMECCLDLKNLPPVSGTGHSIRKVLNSDANNLMLCVHLNFQVRNQFCFIQPQMVSGRVQPFHVATMFGTQDDLIDYCVTEVQLWTLWTNNDGESVSRVCTMAGQQIGNNWVEVIMHPSEETDIFVPSNQDPREVYIDRIFQPGRFSLHDIQKALNVYRRSLDTTALPDSAVQITSLKEEVTYTVEDAIRTTAASNEISEDEYCQLQLDQWSKFYSCCVQYYEVGAKMKGLFADPVTGLVCFIKKGGIGYIRPCDRIEELYLGSGHWQESADGTNPDDSLKRDITTLGMCLRLIRGKVTPDMQLEYQAMLTSEGVENISDDAFTNISLTDEPATAETLANLVQTVHDLPTCLQLILRTLDMFTEDEDTEDEGMDTQHHLSCSQLFSSFTGLSLLSATLQQVAQTGLSALWDLLLLQVSVVNLGEKSGISPQTADVLRKDVIPLTRLLIQCYTVLKWSSMKVAPSTQANSVDRNIRQLATLEISDNSGLTNQQRAVSQNVTIAELFIRGVGGTQARVNIARSGLLEDDPRMSWTLGVLGIVRQLTQLLWPMNPNFLFPEFLVSCCYYLPLQEYIHRLNGWCETNANSRRFMLGLCYLHSDEAQKSAMCFLSAIDGLPIEGFLRRLSLQCEIDNSVPPTYEVLRKWEVLYYLKVIRLFEEFDCADVVVSLASNAIGIADDDDNSPTLWSKLFKYQLELRHNKEAYHAMIGNPDPSRRKDCLRQLLVTLCERGELQTIVDFQYTDEDEVVSILESRARAVDISTQNYYDLLFAFYVSRTNFSKAAEVMYEHGMRLGRELPGKRGLQRQAQCYLAAMNALRLVNSHFAWIVKPSGDQKNSRSAIRPVSEWSFYERESGEENENRRKDVFILELEDIEKEYMLVDARLRLLKKETDPGLSTGPTPGPDEMVGLLVNAGMYDRAIIICQLFDMKLNPVFESLALRCVNLAKSMTHSTLTDNTVLSLAWDWLQENLVTLPGSKENSVTDTAWNLLQAYLDTYEDFTARYHKCVVVKLLSHGFPLPTWLVNSYKKLNWSELLRLYIDFDMLEDGVILTIDAVDAVINTFCGNHSPQFGMKSCPNPQAQCAWLPYTCIDQLLVALDNPRKDLLYQELYEKLERKLNLYNNKIDYLSQCLVDR